MTNIVVTGAAGQLGTAMRAGIGAATFLTHDQLDLGEPDGMRAVLDELTPEILINCAAYTAVDRAQEQESMATRINGTAVAEMAEYCQVSGARFVTFSTDYVFDGVSDVPWLESDLTNPINAYGRSKLVGEISTLAARGLVIRTSWLVSGTHPNFIATMLRLGQERDLRVVDDQSGCPTMADDLVAATLQAIDAGATGVLHCANEGPTTWFEFARAALSCAGLDPGRVVPCATAEFPTPAPRPAYSVLGSERRHSLGVDDLPSWMDSLPRVVEQLFANGMVAAL